MVITDSAVDILEAPMNVSVGLSQAILNLTCSVRRDNVFMEIDGLLTDLNDPELRARGFEHGPATRANGVSTIRVMMELREENNNTRIACFGSDTLRDGRREDIFSPSVTITILGKV